MKMVFKVSYYLRTNYENRQGKTPVMIRVFLNGKMLNFGSSGLNVDRKFWNNSTGRLKGRTADALNFNSQLDYISVRLNEIFNECKCNPDLSLEKIKSIYLGKDKVKITFKEFLDKYLEDIKSLIGIEKTKATYTKYSAVKAHFLRFLEYRYGRKDIHPNELTHLMVHDFDIYLKSVAGLKPNSATKTLKFFKTMVIFARKSGLVEHDPFLNHHFHMEHVDRGFLTDEEIKRIMRKQFATPRLEQVRDIFVFSCFCGLAYIDIVRLTEDNIVELDGHKWIMTRRQKTNVPSNILLLDIPNCIIEKYRGKQKDGRLLPVLSNQKMNAYLKEIADLCGINKNLTCHLARHTFATMALSKGVPVESVSKMLGHTNIKTTQIYAKITNKKVEADMMNFSDKLDCFNGIMNV